MSSVDVAEVAGATGVDRVDAIRLRLVSSVVEGSAADRARDAIGRASTALAGVFDVDPSTLDAANPRIAAAVLERDSPALLDDAIGLSFDEFERRARTWEALADPDGDRERNQRAHANRDVRLRPRPEGGWTITGNLAELDGCEVNETFSWFIDAGWRSDWADARARLGDAATTADLARTDAQRRADAFVAMAKAAASRAPGS